MTSKLLSPVLAASLFLTGCSIDFGPMTPPHAVSSGSAVLQLKAEVHGGGYRAQAGVNPHVATDIALLRLTLHKVDSQGNESAVTNGQSQPLTLDVPKARLADAIRFTKLNARTTYRVKAAAYLDAEATQLISTVDARSQTDIPIFQENEPTLAKIKVQLIDKAFDGQGNSAIDVTPGTLIPAGSESISIISPIPD